jgi:pimeloyl-ACP methyl ester carboxylesterase
MVNSITPSAPVTKWKYLANGQEHTVSFGNNRVRYVTVGDSGPTMVLIHCWGGNLNLWRKQIPFWEKFARLVLIDLPGHGQSDKPNTGYSMDFLARAVVAVLRDRGVDKAILVGHSMGAAVMCQVYKQAPEKVAALVSVDGLLCRPPGTAEQSRMFIGQFCVPEYLQHARKFISDFFPYPGTEKLRDEVVSEILQTPQHVMAGEAEGMVGANQPDWALQNVAVSLLVLNARGPLWNDRSERYVKTMASYVDYRLVDGVGHFLMLEKPAEVNANLNDMLRKADLLT